MQIVYLDNDLTLADLAGMLADTDLRIKADGCGGWLLQREGETRPEDADQRAVDHLAEALLALPEPRQGQLALGDVAPLGKQHHHGAGFVSHGLE